MKNITNCPLCGASSFKNIVQAPYFRGDQERFQIQECNSCQLWFTNPRPEDKDLASYYDTPDYVSHSDSSKGLIDNLYQFVRRIAVKSKLSTINKYSDNKGKLLDYGAGTGYFLKAAKDNGWDVVGIEPSIEARKNAENRGLKLLDPEEYQWKNSTLDAISLWHVLEHLPDLELHMERFTAALKKNGILVLALPNHESYDAKYYRENWAALDVPLHLYHFKKENIKQLSEKNGLVLEEIKNMPFDAFYVSMLSEKIKSKGNYFKAFWVGMKSNLKGRSTKNASSLIYILRKI